jgi:DNA-binding SARP family transcriptional activator
VTAKHTGALHLLGRWRLCWGDTDITLPRGGQRLVALLALRGPAPRVEVATTLWPGRPAGEARALLRRTLWTTAQILPGLISVRPSTLALLPDVIIDTHLLETLAAAATTDPVLLDETAFLDETVLPNETVLPDETAFLDDAALALLLDASDLLNGWYDDWVDEERKRLNDLRLATLETLGDRCLATGASAEALTLSEAAIRLDPLRETPVLISLRAHLAMGNPVLAVRCYHDLRTRLRRELGVDPDVRCLDLLRPYAAHLD